MKARLALLAALIALTSLAFWRGVRDSFDLTKASILWILSVPIWFSALIDFVQAPSRTNFLKRAHWWGLAFALMVAAFTAPRLGYAIIGQPARFTGLLTLSSALLVGLTVARMSGAKPIRCVLVAYSWTSIPACIYVILQAAKSDPFEWVTTSFGTPIFGTIGNPNTASGFIAVCGVMSLWVVNQHDVPRWWKVTSSFALGMSVASMPLLVSFQGQIVVALAGVLALFRLVMVRPIRTGAFWLDASVSSLIVIGPFLPSRTWIFPVITLAIALMLNLLWRTASFDTALSADQRRRQVRLGLGFAAFVVCLGVLTPARDVIGEGLSGGFLERGDFYRSALGVFKAHPVLGGGLENFGFEFTSFRPEGHAVNLENSRPSSVHSIPLAMLSSGGVTLGLAYVVFVVMIGIRVVGLRRKSSVLDPGVYWLLALWLCINVQSLVSVEHVSLYLQFFLVAGLIECSAGTSLENLREHRKSKLVRLERANVLVGVGVALVLAVPLSRPFRANATALDATVELLSSGDRSLAINRYEKVVSLVPWDFYYRYELGFMVFQSGDSQRGAELLLEAAQDSNYIAPIAVPAAAALAQVSRLEDAAQVLMKAVERDPFAPTLRNQAAEYLTQMADAFAGVSDSANAKLFYERAVGLEPDFERALRGLENLRSS